MVETIAIWGIALVLVALGMAGLVFPALPGAPLVFAGLLTAAWGEGFRYVGAGTLTVLGCMALLTYVLDFAAGAFGAKRFGASRRAVGGALLGAVVGLFFGIPGVLLGPFAGAALGELSIGADVRAAGRAGIGATIGLALGAAAKLALALAMLGIYVTVRLFGAG